MKLIKTKKTTPAKPTVGDTVELRFYYFDGRETEVTFKKAKVVKVNKVTFDAETDEGNVYRVNFGEHFNLLGR